LLPPERPAGLRLLGLRPGLRYWRIDAEAPGDWSWHGFPAPRHRFDPTDGGFRTRYASTRLYGAARERYLDTGRFIPADHAGHHVIELVTARSFRCLDLRNEATLDLLGLDDRISTSHERVVWSAGQLLAQRVHGWAGAIDGIVYRPRTTPSSTANVAFWAPDAFTASARPLRECRAELDELVLRRDFTVDFDW